LLDALRNLLLPQALCTQPTHTVPVTPKLAWWSTFLCWDLGPPELGYIPLRHTNTEDIRTGRPGRSPRSQPAACGVFLVLKEAAGPYPGTNLAMSQGTKFAKEKIQLFKSVL